MAFNNPIWEVRTGGSDSNGGGFDTGASGFPTDGASTSSSSATPTFTSASYTFVAGDVGAWIFIKSGTNWIPGWYKITSVSGGGAVLDAAVGHCPLYNASAQGYIGTLNTTAGVGATANATWGIDYSQSDNPIFTMTDMVIDGATNTKFTSAAHPVGKNFVGNVINVTAGSGFTVQRVYVVSTSGTTATCDKSLGTLGSTGGTGAMGGGLLSPALPFSAGPLIATMGVYVQSGSYSITSASTNVVGGCISAGATNTRLEGYQTYRGDLGTVATFTASGINTATLYSSTGASQVLRNINFNGASLSAIRGVNGGGNVQKVKVSNCTNSGFNYAVAGVYVNCAATGCGTAGSGFNGTSVGNTMIACDSYSNTVSGFLCTTGTHFMMCCKSYNNSGASSDGFQWTSGGPTLINCVAYGNGQHGFSGTSQSQLINCVAEANTGTGYTTNNATNGAAWWLVNCAAYNNGTNVSTHFNTPYKVRFVTYTSTAFTNPGSGDFSLLNTGGGLSLKAAGFPGAFPDGTTTGYLDIGAAQAGFAAPGFGGGGTAIFGG